eukprot:jgi/Undpi1/5697/HiC_scaffold_2.g00971.m1
MGDGVPSVNGDGRYSIGGSGDDKKKGRREVYERGDSALDARMEKLGKKMDKWQYVEFGVNAADYMQEMQDVVHDIQQGAQLALLVEARAAGGSSRCWWKLALLEARAAGGFLLVSSTIVEQGGSATDAMSVALGVVEAGEEPTLQAAQGAEIAADNETVVVEGMATVAEAGADTVEFAADAVTVACGEETTAAAEAVADVPGAWEALGAVEQGPAEMARTNRLAFERNLHGSDLKDTDPESGEIHVVTVQPFPSAEERKVFYDQAYEAVSGRLKIDQDTPQQLLVDDLIPEMAHPAAPRGAWSTGIFDCFVHIPSCVTTAFCMCITAGQVAEGARLFKYAFYVTIMVFVCGGVGAPGGLLWIIVGTFIVAKSRARVAKIYNIPLDPFANFCLSLWCNCCVATQTDGQFRFTLVLLTIAGGRINPRSTVFLIVPKSQPAGGPPSLCLGRVRRSVRGMGRVWSDASRAMRDADREQKRRRSERPEPTSSALLLYRKKTGERGECHDSWWSGQRFRRLIDPNRHRRDGSCHSGAWQ